MIRKLISTQTGNCSYALDFSSPSNQNFVFGFSGRYGEVFSFSGISGKLYDNEANLFYSYGQGGSILISGNCFADYHNYFINDVPINTNASRATGHIEEFYIDNIPFDNFNFSFQGEPAQLELLSGTFLDHSTFGIVNFENNSQNDNIVFDIYSGVVTSGSYRWIDVLPQTVTDTGFFNIFSLNSPPAGSVNSIEIQLFTSFGTVSKILDMYHYGDFSGQLALLGSSFLGGTGDYDYDFSYSLTSKPFNIVFEFQPLSGVGQGADFFNITGTQISSFDFTGTRNIVESGTATGLAYIEGTGYNYVLDRDETGIFSRLLTTGFLWATGEQNQDILIPLTGQATGVFRDLINFYSDPVSFTESVLVNVTGSQIISFSTGVDGTGYWSYGNKAVESLFPASLDTTGFYEATGIFSEEVELTATGFKTESTDFQAFLATTLRSGLVDDTFNFQTGTYVLSNGKCYIPYTTPVALTGDYEGYLRTGFNTQGFNLSAPNTETISTGLAFFTGESLANVDALMWGPATGVDGYNGHGIAFLPQINTQFDVLDFGAKTSLSVVEPDVGNCMPLSGIHYFTGAALEISGNTGMAIISNYNFAIQNTIYQGQDGSDGEFSVNPFWFKYLFMTGTTNINARPAFRATPYRINSSGQLEKITATSEIFHRWQFFRSGEFYLNGYTKILSTTAGFNGNYISTSALNKSTSDHMMSLISRRFDQFRTSGILVLEWFDSIAQNNSDKTYSLFSESDFYASDGEFTGSGTRPLMIAEGSLDQAYVVSDGYHVIKEDWDNLQVRHQTGITFQIENLDVTGTRNIEGTGLLPNTSETYPSQITGYQTFSVHETRLNGTNDAFTLRIRTGNLFEAGTDLTFKPFFYFRGITINPGNADAMTGAVYNAYPDLFEGIFRTGNSNEYIVFSGVPQTNATIGVYLNNFTTNVRSTNTLVRTSDVSNGFGYPATGNYLFSAYENGDRDVNFYGQYTGQSTFVNFTGTLTQATGAFNKNFVFTIDDGSGSYILNGYEEQPSVQTIFPVSPPATLLRSGLVNITDFTGFYHKIALGTGIYTHETTIGDLGLTGSMAVPAYIKTFTGEYEFFTGVNTGNLENWFPSKYDNVNLKYTNDPDDFTLTGEGSLTLRIRQKKQSLDSPDYLKLIYSGDSNATGIINIIG